MILVPSKACGLGLRSPTLWFNFSFSITKTYVLRISSGHMLFYTIKVSYKRLFFLSVCDWIWVSPCSWCMQMYTWGYVGACERTMTSSNETFSALLALGARNFPVTGEFPTQRPVTRSFDVFFVWRLNKRRWFETPWIKGWWFETPSRSLWRHRNTVAAWQSPMEEQC